jgi:hypothetical protein
MNPVRPLWLQLLAWLMMAAVYGLFAYVAMVLLRRGRTFQCPACRRQVSREEIRVERIDCPRSGWRAVRVAEDATLAAETQFHEAASGSEVIQLWDGRSYDRESLEQFSPSLAAYAAEHAELTETMPHAAWQIGRKFGVVGATAGTALFGTAFVWAGINQNGAEGAMVGFLISQLLVLPISLVYAASYAYTFHISRPSVTAVNGKLVVRLGSMRVEQFPLRDCEWYAGKLKEMNFLEKIMLPADDAVILVVPGADHEGDERRLAVGYTNEMREVWHDFLDAAGLPRLTAREHRPIGRRMLSTASGAALLLVAFPGSMWLGKNLEALIRRLGGRADLAEAMGMMCFLPGWFYLLGYVCCLWPWKGLHRIASTRTVEERRKITRYYAFRWSLVGVFFALAYGTAWGWGLNWNATARLAAALVAGLTAPLVGYDLGRRVARSQWEKFESRAVQHADAKRARGFVDSV